MHRRNSDVAVFIGAQSIQIPNEYDDMPATTRAHLAARLPYVFAVSRFAQYLKCIVRDGQYRFTDRADMQRTLQNWILAYVDGDPENSSEWTKCQRPLAAAEVVLDDVPGDASCYMGKFFFRPHYRLEGLTVSLRLISTLPSVGSR